MFNREGWFWVAVVLMAISTRIATAKAVDYCIEVMHPTNIRSSYSLDSDIWDTVPAGTALRVTYEGTQGNWLKVDYLSGNEATDRLGLTTTAESGRKKSASAFNAGWCKRLIAIMRTSFC
ncbi:MAG: hypothetical protein OXG78_06875 [Chloroflexi bacterium]|nr:hypothetical protein [Chloroflexota bacterium]